MKNVVIAGAVRTAIGNFGGSLADTSAVELGTAVIKSAIERAGIDITAIDEVIMEMFYRQVLDRILLVRHYYVRHCSRCTSLYCQ